MPRQELPKKMNDLALCTRFLAAARQVADVVSSGETRNYLLYDIAAVQAGAGDLPAALETVEAISVETLAAKNVKAAKAGVLRRFARLQLERGDIPGAMERLSEARKIQLGIDDLFDDMVSLAKAGAITEAKELAKSFRISSSHTVSSALVHIAAVQVSRGDLAEAAQTAFGIEDDTNRSVALCAVADAVRLGADAPEIRRLLNTIREAAKSLHGSEEKNHVLSSVGEAQSSIGDMAGISATAKATRSRLTKSYIVSGAVKAFAERGDIASVLKVTEMITNADEKSRILGCAAACRAQASDLATALVLVDLIPPDSDRQVALWAIAMAQARAGNLGAAAATFNAAGNCDDWKKLKAWCEIVGAGMALDQTGARRMFQEMKTVIATCPDSANRWYTMQTIAAAQAEAGDIAGAVDTLAAVIDAGIKIGEDASRSLFRAYVKVRDWPTARLAAATIPTDMMRARAWCDLSVALLEANRPAEAYEALDEARKLSFKPSGDWNVGGLSLDLAIAVGYAQSGDAEGARRILDAREASLAEVKLWAPTLGWRDVVLTRAQTGDFAGAIRSLMVMPEPFNDKFRGKSWGAKARFAGQVTARLLEVKSGSEVEAWAKALPDPIIRAGAYLELARSALIFNSKLSGSHKS